MRWCTGSTAWFAIITLIACLLAEASSFTPVPIKASASLSSCKQHQSLSDNEGQQSPAQKKQEQIMEMASIAGAKAIAELDIQERTKRAMLAEAVEDRIFELVDELEEMVRKSGGLENLTGDIKEEAVEMAKQTKALQVQYDDLVSGRPSPLLDLGGTTADFE